MSTSTVTTEELVGRLESMAARLGDQEARIAEQQAEIAQQQAEMAQQRAEIARLRAERPAPAAGAAPAPAGAAAAEPRQAQAGVDGDVVLGGTSPPSGAVGTTTRIVANAFPALQIKNSGYTGFVSGVSNAIEAYTTGSDRAAFFARNESDGGVGFEALMVNGVGVLGDSV